MNFKLIYSTFLVLIFAVISSISLSQESSKKTTKFMWANKPIQCFTQKDLIGVMSEDNFKEVSPIFGGVGVTMLADPTTNELSSRGAVAYLFANAKDQRWVLIEILPTPDKTLPNACILMKGQGVVFDKNQLITILTPREPNT